jgi:hypothetical protein
LRPSSKFLDSPQKKLSLGSTPESSPRSVKIIVVDKIPSVESDIPSLASSISQSSLDDAMKNPPAYSGRPGRIRSLSVPVTKADEQKQKISFDPRVWVREFRRTPEEKEVTWYSTNAMPWSA